MQWGARTWLLGLMVGMTSVLYAATAPKISPSKRTGKVRLVTHSITFARHETVTITVASLDTQTRDGSKALQAKDTATDVACTVKIQRSGDMAVFKDTGTFTFDVIDAEDEYRALQGHVPQLAKVVGAITWCATPGTFDGCTLPGHIVVRKVPGHPLTLTHEFGHHKGLSGDPTAGRLMNDATVNRGSEITAAQCSAFKTP